jgi:diacylglycerol kinase (ATP)
MTRGKAAILFNPSSGKGRALDRKSYVEARLREIGLSFDLFVTRSEEDLRALARACGETHGTVVGVGGDSTFHWIVNELVRSGSSASFGMIGTGSSNDIDREFGLDSPDKAFVALKGGRTRRVDLGLIERDGTPVRYYLGQANIGLGARVNIFVENQFQKRPWLGRRQTLAGILGIVDAFRSKDLPLRLSIIPGGGAAGEYTLAAFSNIRYWATGRMICPEAVTDDGMLDACLIGKTSFFGLLRIARLAGAGKHGKKNGVVCTKAKRFDVSSETPFVIQTDGEIVGAPGRPERFDRVTFRAVPKALDLVCG